MKVPYTPHTPLGIALHFLRRRKKLEPYELAKLSGVGVGAVHQLEFGRDHLAPVGTVKDLLSALGADERESEFVLWVMDHSRVDPCQVIGVLQKKP